MDAHILLTFLNTVQYKKNIITKSRPSSSWWRVSTGQYQISCCSSLSVISAKKHQCFAIAIKITRSVAHLMIWTATPPATVGLFSQDIIRTNIDFVWRRCNLQPTPLPLIISIDWLAILHQCVVHETETVSHQHKKNKQRKSGDSYGAIELISIQITHLQCF